MPYSPYGYFPSFMPMYPGGPYALQLCFPYPYPPIPFTPYPMQPGYPMQPYATSRPRAGMRPVYIVLIIIGVLLVIGGCVAAAILLTGQGGSSFKLGNGTVKGVDIEFRDITLTQEGNRLALTGTYDNGSKREGNVSVAVQVISNGSQQTLSFKVPVEPGSGERFATGKDVSFTISGATLGSLVFQAEEGYEEDGTPYPRDEEDSTEDRTTPSDKENSTSSSSVVPVDKTVQYQGIELKIVSVKIEPGADGRVLLTINIEAKNQSGEQVFIFWSEETRLIDEKGEEFALDDYDMETDYTPATQAEGQLFIPVDNKDQIFTLQFGKKSLPKVDLKLDLAGAD